MSEVIMSGVAMTEEVKKPRNRKPSQRKTSQRKPTAAKSDIEAVTPTGPPSGQPSGPPPVFTAIGAALDCLERGIASSNWEEVANAYQLMTGKVAPRSGRPDALAMLRDIGDSIGRYLEGASPVTPLPEMVVRRQESTQSGSLQSGSLQLSPQSESEVQSVTVADSDDPLIQESRLLSAQMAGRGRQTRPPFQLVDVICGRCQRTLKVNPSLVPPRVAADDNRPPFICNQCISR